MQPGIYSYKYLPLPGAQVFTDTAGVASYSYDPAKRELVSYDTPDIVRTKAEYVMSTGLAGCLFWEVRTRMSGQGRRFTPHTRLALDRQDGCRVARADRQGGVWRARPDPGTSPPPCWRPHAHPSPFFSLQNHIQ